MIIKRIVFGSLMIILSLSGLMMGIFVASGLCIFFWGPGILDTALGSPPDRSHPAFWCFLFFMILGMIVNVVGMITTVVLPLCIRFPQVAQSWFVSDTIILGWFRNCAIALQKYCDNEIERLNAKRRNDKA